MSTPEGLHSPARRGPGVYGWRIVAVAFLVDFVAVGFFFYSYGVFFKTIAADLGGSRFGVSLGISISNAVGALLAPFVGRAVDRHPIKRIMIGGAALVSLGFALLAGIDALWQFYVLLGTCLAFGMSMMGGIGSAKLVTNWFTARRGAALGIATMGISLSGLLMPTLATWLVAELGWRGGFVVYAICTFAIVVPLVAGFVVDRPEDMGLRPDGAAETDPAASALDESAWHTRDILRSRNFWSIAIPFALVLSALSAILVHLVPYADDLGIAPYRAAWVLSVSAGAGALGKLVFGRLFDRIDPRFAIWGSFGTQTAGLLLLMQGPSYAALLVGAAVFGLGMGGVIPLHGATAGAAFGRLSFGKVMGLLRPVQVPLHAVGVPLAGWIHDATGSYALAFQIFVGVYLAASAAITTLRLKAPAGSPPASAGDAGFA
jgi:MFS family permease